MPVVILLDVFVIMRFGVVVSGFKAAFLLSSYSLVFQACEANDREANDHES